MARIRSIKPEFWVSEQVADCSVTARLLFIGLWNFADDGGVIPYKPKAIKAQVFPADDITSETIRRLVDELLATALLASFEADGQTYLFVTGWKKHQRIEKVNIKYPRPPADILDGKAQLSLPIRRPVDDQSAPERKGKDRIGEEGKGVVVDDKSPTPTSVDGEPWRKVIIAFDEARVQAFGENQARPNPHGSDRTDALRYLEAGATIDLCRDVFLAGMQRAKAGGRQPPANLKYFERPIADAIAGAKVPMPKARTQPAEIHVQTQAETDELEKSNANLIKRFGRQPDVSLSQVRGMIAKGLLTDAQARTAGYGV